MKTSENVIDRISKRLPFSKETIRKVVNKTFSEMKERMGKDEKVMLRGFMKCVCASREKTKTYSNDEYKDIKTKDK